MCRERYNALTKTGNVSLDNIIMCSNRNVDKCNDSDHVFCRRRLRLVWGSIKGNWDKKLWERQTYSGPHCWIVPPCVRRKLWWLSCDDWYNVDVKIPKITVYDSAWILTQKDDGGGICNGTGTCEKERLACEYSDVTVVDPLSDLI